MHEKIPEGCEVLLVLKRDEIHVEDLWPMFSLRHNLDEIVDRLGQLGLSSSDIAEYAAIAELCGNCRGNCPVGERFKELA